MLLGNGDGSFQVARSVAAGSLPASVAVGDFSGDGAPDLVVANHASNNVSVLLGYGDGSFQVAQSFGVASAPYSAVVGDFNGDGAPDLAVASTEEFGRVSIVSVLLGSGDGSFQAAWSFGVGATPYSMAVGDFNGDGAPDLAVANQSSNNVSVLINNSRR